MPSPFPGMDPYLEQNDWVSVHAAFSVHLAQYLSPLSRPKYFVRVGRKNVLMTERVKKAKPRRSRKDVSVYAGPDPPAPRPAASAVLTPPLKPSMAVLEVVPKYRLKIRDVKTRSVVTAIGVLSMSNKSGSSRKKYLAKREGVLAGETHLKEIDLPRAGRRVPMSDHWPDEPYFVILSRSNQRRLAGVWPIPIRSPLPVVPVPLLPGDPDVPLDLQAVFTSLYDTFNYDLEIDYKEPLDGPLSPDDRQWADERIRQWKAARADK